MYITSRKTRVQLARIGLHPVTNPLLFRRVHRLNSNAGLRQQTIRLVLRQRQDSGNLSSYEEILSVGPVVWSLRASR